ncbi:MAG TPA: hypothetical protein VFA89_11270 [Terriglobales bacterium]|nr:hypothetical protein [Terriglobales bacterium]
MKHFPIGDAMNKNLKVNMGNCNHRAYIPKLVDLVRMNAIRPSRLLTQQGPLTDVIDPHKNFDKREAAWVKVTLEPSPGSGPVKAA